MDSSHLLLYLSEWIMKDEVDSPEFGQYGTKHHAEHTQCRLCIAKSTTDMVDEVHTLKSSVSLSHTVVVIVITLKSSE